MTRVDHFTNTPEDAAKFERRYGPDYSYDDRPEPSDFAEPEVDETLDEPECRICRDEVVTCPECDPDHWRDMQQDR